MCQEHSHSMYFNLSNLKTYQHTYPLIFLNNFFRYYFLAVLIQLRSFFHRFYSYLVDNAIQYTVCFLPLTHAPVEWSFRMDDIYLVDKAVTHFSLTGNCPLFFSLLSVFIEQLLKLVILVH